MKTSVDRLSLMERAMWAARGRTDMPFACLLPEEQIIDARDQGWPLIRLYDIIGDIVGAGPAPRSIFSPQSDPDRAVSRRPVRIFETMRVATVFECRDEGVILSKIRLDLPDGRVRVDDSLDAQKLYLRGAKLLAQFEGPFYPGTFADEEGWKSL
jgi:hypothetical protein